MTYLSVFLAGLTIDLAYVSWMNHVAAGNYGRAAFWSVAIGACSLIGLTSVIGNSMTVVPWLLGLAAGTVAGMYIGRARP
jgi:hypothetical protein